jgi:hypothetical protein
VTVKKLCSGRSILAPRRDPAPQSEMSHLPETPPETRVRRGERGRARRRLAYLRRVRELQLRDVGGFVFDLYRFGERRDHLVREKLDALIATDKEIHGLEALLDRPARERVYEVRMAGVGGACPDCGDLHASDARFCAHCGRELGAETPPPVPLRAVEDGEAPPPAAEHQRRAES